MDFHNLKLSDIKKEMEEKDGVNFPAKSYTAFELKPAYDNAKTNFLDIMKDLNKIQLIMLLEQEIINPIDAVKIKKALDNLPIKEMSQGEYTGEYEDLFFEMENKLLKYAGESAGNLHIGRSRNDLCVALYRVTIRKRLLKLIESGSKAHLSLVAFSKEHRDSIMIAHTHTQQAQPTTLGHYMIGASFVITRDIKRMQNAYKTVNRSPLGAGAITTSGYKINRRRVCELGGFEDIIENSYDCIGGGDYLGETATSIMLSAIDLGRIVNDLLLFCTNEMGILHVAPAYIQISSIMPQKRNPVAIEHMRAILSAVIGQCTTVLTMLHNTPYGDIVDTEDDLQPFLWKALDLMDLTYELLYGVIATLEVNKDIMVNRANESLAVITELADTITREEKVTFKKAHEVASSLVNKCIKENKTKNEITFDDINEIFKNILGRFLKTDEEVIMKSLDPKNFIEIRKIQGGPAKEPMDIMFKLNIDKYNENQVWINNKKEILSISKDQFKNAYDKI